MTRTALAAVLAVAVSLSAAAQVPDLVSHSQLRVCADPNDLPFSNDKREGFENKIADLVGQDLKLPVTFVWFPQVVGFVRNTLRKNECDLVMGTVSGDAILANTDPYYHTGYMIVTRADSGITATEIGDPALADKKIGLIASTPPTDLLIQHHLMDHVTSYSLVIDTRFDSPSRQMLQDLVDKKLDAGLVWGPFAGYYIKHDHLPLKAVFLQAEGSERFDFHISMGVRANDTEWRRRVDQAINRHKDDITRILVDYGVPLLDEQNKPLEAPAPAP